MDIKPAFIALLIAATLTLTTGRNTYAEEAAGDVSLKARIAVRYERGRVDVTAENAPLAAVVAKLSAMLNIPLEIKGPAQGLITLRLRDMAVEATLKSLSRNVITIYDDSGKKLKKAILITNGGSLNPGENAGEYIHVEQPTASPDVNSDPSQAAQPEGWSEPPPQDITPLQTWVGQP